jgi:hypothetical protein
VADETIDRGLEQAVPVAGDYRAQYRHWKAGEHFGVANVGPAVGQWGEAPQMTVPDAVASPAQAARRPGSSRSKVACSVVVPIGKPRLNCWSKDAPTASPAGCGGRERTV